jgi:hypothetical protein
MKNLTKSIGQLDNWLNNQTWLNIIIDSANSLIGSVVTSTNAGLNYCRYLFSFTMFLGIMLGAAGAGLATTILTVGVAFMLLLRCIDGVEAMRSSSIFSAITDSIRLLVGFCVVVTGFQLILLLLGSSGTWPIFGLNVACDVCVMGGLMIAKNIMERP